METSTRRRSVRGTLIASAIAVVAMLSFIGPASAHNYYISSTPEPGEVLTTLPEKFIVTTNDNLLDLGGMEGGFFIEIGGSDGLYYGDGCVTVSGPSVTTAADLGPAGDYTLDWQVVSADGHTVSGEVFFSWQPSEGEESVTTGATTPPSCGKEAGEPEIDTPKNTQDVANDSTADILWIGGAIGAVALAVIATLLLLRPKSKPGAEGVGRTDEPNTE